jgi:tRNA threonylcarbamoyladenosine biosynthesis protein TsaE
MSCADENEYFCGNEEAVAALARCLALSVRAPDTIGFSGELGAGKTTFIRSLCEALGSTVPVSSPTYVLSFEYPTTSGILIEHWDLYRVREPVPELLEPPASHVIRLIEWCERMTAWGEFPQREITLGFGEESDDNGRVVKVRGWVTNPLPATDSADNHSRSTSRARGDVVG